MRRQFYLTTLLLPHDLWLEKHRPSNDPQVLLPKISSSCIVSTVSTPSPQDIGSASSSATKRGVLHKIPELNLPVLYWFGSTTKRLAVGFRDKTIFHPKTDSRARFRNQSRLSISAEGSLCPGRGSTAAHGDRGSSSTRREEEEDEGFGLVTLAARHGVGDRPGSLLRTTEFVSTY